MQSHCFQLESRKPHTGEVSIHAPRGGATRVEDYRFIRVVKAGNEYFELRECPHDRPFAKEVAEAMLQAAQSFTLVG